jgi:hypothetical protein
MVVLKVKIFLIALASRMSQWKIFAKNIVSIARSPVRIYFIIQWFMLMWASLIMLWQLIICQYIVFLSCMPLQSFILKSAWLFKAIHRVYLNSRFFHVFLKLCLGNIYVEGSFEYDFFQPFLKITYFLIVALDNISKLNIGKRLNNIFIISVNIVNISLNRTLDFLKDLILIAQWFFNHLLTDHQIVDHLSLLLFDQTLQIFKCLCYVVFLVIKILLALVTPVSVWWWSLL